MGDTESMDAERAQPVRHVGVPRSVIRALGRPGVAEPTDGGRPLLVVDAANVVGSVPDGWWRDRAGATERLRDGLVRIAENGVPGWTAEPPLDVVLVVEGAARGVRGVAGVEVVAAAGVGDDAVVELVRAAGRPCAVITADRELRARVTELGAEVLGPRSVRPD
jgi:hypothetical protein